VGVGRRAYDDPAPAGARPVHLDRDTCPFCGGAVEHGAILRREGPLPWQPAGTRRRRQRVWLGPRRFMLVQGLQRLPAHRCGSCGRVWFREADLDL
jgi:hypothetical protein